MGGNEKADRHEDNINEPETKHGPGKAFIDLEIILLLWKLNEQIYSHPTDPDTKTISGDGPRKRRIHSASILLDR
jgi:hypothetical protein